MSNTSTPITVPVELDTTKLDRYLQHIKEERELEREENLYKKLPLLIREIILDAILPLPTCKGLVEREIEEKLSKKEPSKSSKNPTNNNKKKKTPPKTNTEVLDKVSEATKIIEDFEETTALKKEDLKEVKEQNKKTTEELEATMYDLFKEEKPKKRKKKKK